MPVKTTSNKSLNLNWLHRYDIHTLLRAGFAPAGAPSKGKVLLLCPASLYNNIPNGTTMTTMNFKTEVFIRGVSTYDKRDSHLPYGIVVKGPRKYISSHIQK